MGKLGFDPAYRTDYAADTIEIKTHVEVEFSSAPAAVEILAPSHPDLRLDPRREEDRPKLERLGA